MAATTQLPKVRTDEAFKKKVYKACKRNRVTYSQAVRILMYNLIEGKIKIEADEDRDFVESAKMALESKGVKKALKKLEKFLAENPDRKYTNVKKA